MQRSIFLILMLVATGLQAQIRKELFQLETKYHTGSVDELADRLPTIKANNDDERAFISYYGALLKKDKAEALSLHLRAGERYAKTEYGQKSLLEAAIIQVLDRNFAQAQMLLRKISSAQLPERMYWLSVVSYWQDDFPSAIAQAENYLRLKPQGALAENAIHLISDVYIEQGKYHSAQANLDKITQIKDYDRQYYLYKLAYSHELGNKLNDALAAYRQSYEIDKYSQVAFAVEERLFAIRAKRPSLDLSFLYPYTPLEIAPSDSSQVSSLNPPESKPPAKLSEATELFSSIPIKILAKPQNGFYLQSGRFSVESNAQRLAKSIREMQMPAVYYEDLQQGKSHWVVLAGPFAGKDESGKAKDLLAKSEINSFVIQY